MELLRHQDWNKNNKAECRAEVVVGDFGSDVTIVDAVKAKVGFGWETNDRGSRVKR